MDINEIRKEAQDLIKRKKNRKYVSRYVDLLELKDETEKQLNEIEESIKLFEADPERYCDESDPIW